MEKEQASFEEVEAARRAMSLNREHSKGAGNFPRPEPRVPAKRPPAGPAGNRARPHKPAATELSKRKAAAMGSGGDRLPPSLRKLLDGEPKKVRPKKDAHLRTGKREPKAGRWVRAGEMHGAMPSRKSRNPAPSPGTRRARAAKKAQKKPFR